MKCKLRDCSISIETHKACSLPFRLAIDKQEGIFVGGKPEFTGVKSFEVSSDYQNSCIDDIRYDMDGLQSLRVFTIFCISSTTGWMVKVYHFRRTLTAHNGDRP